MTGATGLLGRNLLFEILKQNLGNLDGLEIIVLGRPIHTAPLDHRLQAIFDDDGYYYINVNPKDTSLTNRIKSCIIPISFDLTKKDLDISPKDLKILKEKKIDHFFHVAALTDFRTGSSVEAILNDVNVKGTQKVLGLIKQLDVGQFVYVSSAYACGSKTGLVEPDYINLNENFRNPYEKSKLEAEILVRNFAKDNNLKIKIFRPSTICGRLIEKPIGAINKFDVFYAWGGFFLRLKVKALKTFENIYKTPYEFPIRIHFNPESGLNIVPSDYSAKVLYRATFEDWEGDSFHLVNNEETPHKLYVSYILEAIGITGCSFVENEPIDKNKIERFYYKTVGKLFTPYTLNDPTTFNVSDMERYLQKSGLKCPKVDRNNLVKLIDFAKKKYFNLSVSQ